MTFLTRCPKWAIWVAATLVGLTAIVAVNATKGDPSLAAPTSPREASVRPTTTQSSPDAATSRTPRRPTSKNRSKGVDDLDTDVDAVACGTDGCQRGEPRGPVGYIDGMQEVTWPQATKWWTHGKLLKSPNRPSNTPFEVVLASSNKGGTKSKATESSAALSVFYFNDQGSPFNSYFGKIFDSGGVQIAVHYYPPGETVSWAPSFSEQEIITVRGHQARLVELHRNQQSNVDWRAIRWEEPSPAGGVVQWGISNHPDRYTREQTIQFTNDLVEQ